MAGTVRFTSRVIPWSSNKTQDLDVALLEAMTDVHRIAGMFAPKQTRALANSGRIHREGVCHYTVIFGGNGVAYARRRHYENRKTPSSLRYLERAGDGVARNFTNYVTRSRTR